MNKEEEEKVKPLDHPQGARSVYGMILFNFIFIMFSYSRSDGKIIPLVGVGISTCKCVGVGLTYYNT